MATLQFAPNPLQGFDVSSLQPDSSGLADAAGNFLGQKYAQGQADEQAEEDIQTAEDLQQEQTVEALVSDEQFLRLAQRDPGLARFVLEGAVVRDDAETKRRTGLLDREAKFAGNILSTSQDQWSGQFTRRAQEEMAAGNKEAAKEFIRLANLSTTDPAAVGFEMREDIADSELSQDIFNRLSLGESKVLAKDAILVGPTGKTIASNVGGGTPVKFPPILREGLSEAVGDKGEAAFTASGGGKDGMKAFHDAVNIAKEDERREQASGSLAVTYPGATPQEMTQLQAAINSAPTVEKGMAVVETVRTNQRAAQKSAILADRSLYLVGNILANDELDDVVGSSEGKYGGSEQPSGAFPVIGGFISDKEAEAIADIEEITNILTVPAMELMTGILSESDLKLLKTISGGAFTRTRGSERFKKDAGQVQRILKTASIIGKLGPKDREAAVWATDKKNMSTPQGMAIRKKLGLPNG